jgi:hypothetical protein
LFEFLRTDILPECSELAPQIHLFIQGQIVIQAHERCAQTHLIKKLVDWYFFFCLIPADFAFTGAEVAAQDLKKG